MTPLHAVASVAILVVACACVGFWRFRPLDVNALAGYTPVPERPDQLWTVVGVAAFIAWVATIFALAHFGCDALQGVVLAGVPSASLASAIIRFFLRERCSVCLGEVPRFRKKQPPETPAIFHLKVFEHGKTYRQELIIGVGNG